MAKKAKPAQEIVLTDKQKNIAKQFEGDVEKSTTYKSIAAIVNKLNNKKTKLSAMEINALLGFFDGKKFTADIVSSLKLDQTQKENLVVSTKKQKNPELAYNVARKILDYKDAPSKSLTKLINKNKELFVDYASYYYNTNVQDPNKNVNWCPDWILKNVKRNLSGRKPKADSYEYLATFFHNTVHYRTEEENNALIQKWADRLFGTDEDIAKKKIKRNKVKLTERKNKFISNVGVAIAEQYNADLKAKFDVLEAEENEKLKNDDKFMAMVNEKTNQIFNENHKEDFLAGQKFMEALKKEHPKDLEKYLAKLRKSKAYQKAYDKYTKQYQAEKEEIRAGAFDDIKLMTKTSAQKEVIAKSTNTNVKESAPELTK